MLVVNHIFWPLPGSEALAVGMPSGALRRYGASTRQGMAYGALHLADANRCAIV